jgi:hypothetical protein
MPNGDAGDPILDARNPNCAHACNCRLRPRQHGYGPTRWVMMAVNPPANEMRCLDLTMDGPSHDAVNGQVSLCAT